MAIEGLDVEKKPSAITVETIKFPHEIYLGEEWKRQAQNLARYFAEELRMTQEQYIATLPTFEPQLENYKGRFDIPVIVETRISLKKMVELVGIRAYFGVNSIKDWGKGTFKTPDVPYTAWVNDGISNLNKPVSEIRKSLKQDERGATIYDGVALYLRYPEILENHFLDFPGSQVPSSFAPSLHLWLGLPMLDRYFISHADSKFGSVVAGKI